MYYSDELIEEVRGRTDIVEIISGYVKLTKKGANYFGLCPFHGEKSPSFSVSSSKQMYYCFGCGAGGNVFSFLMKYENFTFQETVKNLADKAGVDLPEQEYSAEARRAADRKSMLLEINKEAARYFYYQLRASQGENGHRYLKERGLTEETLHKFGLGYANKSSNDLVLYLKNKGYTDELIVQAGLATAHERYGVQDKFWNRVIFPIMDVNHRAIGFGGRVMGEGSPKYLNSPETPVFDKSRNLYGLNFARTSRRDNILLCEGYMDVIALHQAGFIQAVASLGTAFTLGQANLLRRYTSQVILAYDSDGAGTGAAIRALGILREAGLSGRVIDLRPYKDPDEFILALGREAFQERIAQAENGFLFEVRMLHKGVNMQDPEERTSFYREIAVRLCRFTEEVERNNYLEAVAERYCIGVNSLKTLVETHAVKTGEQKPVDRPKSGIQSKNTAKEGSRKAQRLLITWLTEEPGLYKKVSPYLSASDFTEPIYAKVAEKMFEEFDGGNFSPGRLVSLFEEEEEHRQVAELFNTKLELSDSAGDREKAFRDILLRVKEHSLRHYSEQLGSEVSALNQVLEAKKALEELKKTHISLEE